MKILSGIDIVENSRIKRLLERSPKAAEDIFSPIEIEYCKKKKRYVESYAARFAAKEAVIKASDTGILHFDLTKIEMVNAKSGKPSINIKSEKLHNRLCELLEKDSYEISISVSHEKEYSVAQVIIY